MKIKSIRIVHMHNVDEKQYDFDNVNYISGLNGAGKSTVLEAIQLAIFGYIPGYSKRNQDIIKHANSDFMSVRLVFDDDNFIDRRYMKTSSGATSDLDTSFDDISSIVDEIELPIYNFNQFLGLSPNEQKKWFLGFLPKDKNDIDWETELKSRIKDEVEYTDDVFDDIMNGIKDRDLADVTSIHEYIKSMISFVNGQIKAKNSILSDMAYYEDISVYDEAKVKDELSKRNDELSEAKIQLNNFDMYIQLMRSIEDYRRHLKATTIEDDEDYISYQKHIEWIDSEIKSKQAEADDANEELNNLTEKIAELSFEVVKYHDAKEVKDVCPIISEIHCDKLIEYRDECSKKYDEVSKAYSTSLEKSHDVQDKVDKLYAEIKQLGNERTDVSAKRLRLEMDYELYAERINQLNTNFAGFEDSQDCSEFDLYDKIDFLNNEIGELQDKLSKIYANQKYESLEQSNKAELSMYENELALLKILKDYTGPNELQQTLYAKPFLQLQENITRSLKQMFNRDDIECYMNLSTKSNSFEFGMKRNGMIIPFTVLSNGERCMYMLALQSAILAAKESNLKVIMVDDVFDHLDEANIESLTNAILHDEDIQYIIAGVAIVPKREGFNKLNRIMI